MITRVFGNLLKQTKLTPTFRFGSAHSEIHEHHDQHAHASHSHHHHVKLDPNASWVQFAKNKQLVSVYGFEDKIDVFEHDHIADVYEHMNDVEKWSLQYFFDDQANFHPEEHDPLANEPHGYFIGDDPLDARYSLPNSLIVTMILSSLVLGFSYLVGGYKDYTKPFHELIADQKQKSVIMEQNIANLLLKRSELDEENAKLRTLLK